MHTQPPSTLPRCTLLFILFIGAIGGTGTRSALAEPAVPQPVRIFRPSAVGESAEITLTSNYEKSNTITKHGGSPAGQKQGSEITLAGTYTVTATNNRSEATAATFAVKSASAIVDGKPVPFVKADDFISANRTPDGTIYEIAGTLVGDVALKALLSTVMPLAPLTATQDERPDEDHVFGPPGGEARPGESWEIEPERFLAFFRSQSEIPAGLTVVTAKAGFDSAKSVDGVACQEINARITLDGIFAGLPKEFKPTKKEMELVFSWLLPTDPALPQFGQGFSTETAIRATGTTPGGNTVDLDVDSKHSLHMEVHRLVVPAQAPGATD